MKIKLIKDYYDKGSNIYDKASVDLKPGFTVLVGCNGAGKTTMLRQIKQHCEKENIPVLLHDNYQNDNKSSWDSYLNMGDISRLATSVISSEGERISISLGDVAKKIGQFIGKHPNDNELVILLDAIDSGFSIDNIVEIKDYMIDFIINDCKKNDVILYFVASANTYELARGEQCLNVNTCKYIKIKDYEDYRKIILESRDKKEVRYGRSS